MPTQKIFKQRVRTRMAKTGESYTAARHQLLRRAEAPVEATPAAVETPALPPGFVPAVSAESMRRATGKDHAEWFAILDAWDATEHTHTEISRWLRDAQGVPGWWDQSVTVDYERARGMRRRHEMPDGFTVSATKTIATSVEAALASFTDPVRRAEWLPAAPLRQRPTRAARAARFDWAEPASRVVVGVVPHGEKIQVSVAHEQVPSAAQAAELKAMWRERLAVLKARLERG